MSRQRKARPRAKRYLQRPVSLPMTGAKRNEIALHMHAAFTGVAAGALLAACGDGQATELDRFTLDGVTRTGAEILDMADAALAQGQEEA